MKLFLLTTLTSLDADLLEALKVEIATRGNRVAYISSLPHKEHFEDALKALSSISPFVNVEYFDFSSGYSDQDLRNSSLYGTVIFGDGDIVSFMRHARERNYKELLDEHIRDDGLVVGVGASACLLTSTIGTALIGKEAVGLEGSLDGFGYVDFLFFPDYEKTGIKTPLLFEHTQAEKASLYAVAPGAGIFQSGASTRSFGEAEALLLKM